MTGAYSAFGFPVTLFIGIGQINPGFDQGLFEPAGVEAVELLPANEHQGNSFSTLALKLDESPLIAFDILFPESHTLLPQKSAQPMAMRTPAGGKHCNPGCGGHWPGPVSARSAVFQLRGTCLLFSG